MSYVTIPEGVTTIGKEAFYGCSALADITLPNSLTKIGERAFFTCSKLTSIHIPANVTSISDRAFSYCDRLTGIWVDENNPNYSNDSYGVLFNKDKTTLICAPGAFRGSYVVPNSVTTVSGYAFFRCSELTCVVIPDGVISIGVYTFDGDKQLVSVTLPAGITSVGDCAFRSCSALKNVFFEGTQGAWGAITIGTDNTPLTNATFTYNFTDGAHSHTYVESVVAPTCTRVGYTAYTCSTCGDRHTTNETPVVAHTAQTVSGRAPACVANGFTEGSKCSVCGKILTVHDVIPATGHTYEKTVIAPTCTTAGYTADVCACGDAINIADELAAFGHTEVIDAAVALTCTTDGFTAGIHCSVCGDAIIAQEVIPALGHKYKDLICSVCGNVCNAVDITISYFDQANNTSVEVLIPAGHKYFITTDSNGQATPKGLFGEKGTLEAEPEGCNIVVDNTVYPAVATLDNAHIYVSKAAGNGKYGSAILKFTGNGALEIQVESDSTFKYATFALETNMGQGTTITCAETEPGVCALLKFARWDGDSGQQNAIAEKVGSLTIKDARIDVYNFYSSSSDTTRKYCLYAKGDLEINNSSVALTANRYIGSGIYAGGNLNINNGSVVSVSLSGSKAQTTGKSPKNAFCGVHVAGEEFVIDNASLSVYISGENSLAVSKYIFNKMPTLKGVTAKYSDSLAASMTAVKALTDFTSFTLEPGTDMTGDTYKHNVYYFEKCEHANKPKQTDCTIAVACPDCGTVWQETAHALEYARKDTDKHIVSCSNEGCEYATEEAHTNSGEQTDCAETAICPDCGEVLIPAKDHVPSTAADCLNAQICTVCGAELAPALGHTEVVDAAVPPTCAKTGLTEGKHCSVCNEVLVAQTVVDALGHTEVIDAAVAPTCTKTGLTEGKHCSVCNEVLVAQTVVDALGHTEVVDAAVAPTCTATGMTEGKHCAACGEILVAQEKIAALGHTWADATCTAAKTCLTCGTTEGEALGHTYKYDVCTVCGISTIWKYAISGGEVTLMGYTGSALNLVIPSTIEGLPVVTLADSLLHNCISLTSVLIPDSITNIGASAFDGCAALRNVYYRGTKAQWNAIAIGNNNDNLLAATLVCDFAGTPEEVLGMPGDIDGDEEVTQDDAVYLLLHTMFGEMFYPLEGANGDIDRDGSVTQEDAVYLLLHTMFGDMFYPLNPPVLPTRIRE